MTRQQPVLRGRVVAHRFEARPRGVHHARQPVRQGQVLVTGGEGRFVHDGSALKRPNIGMNPALRTGSVGSPNPLTEAPLRDRINRFATALWPVRLEAQDAGLSRR